MQFFTHPPPPSKKKSSARRTKYLFSLVAQYTINIVQIKIEIQLQWDLLQLIHTGDNVSYDR